MNMTMNKAAGVDTAMMDVIGADATIRTLHPQRTVVVVPDSAHGMPATRAPAWRWRWQPAGAHRQSPRL